MTTTTTALLPRNKTGLYAGDTLQEVKVPRSHGSGIPVLRQAGTTNGLLAPVEQDRMPKNTGPSSYSDADSKGIRNGFRPSVIRRQKARVKTAMTHHENRYRDLNDLLSNDILPSSPASARLKAEIDQLNSQLKIYGDLKKLLRVQNNPDAPPSSQSALSYTTNRVSSASTNRTISRLHQRFPSTLTNTTLTNGLRDLSPVTSPSPLNEQELKRDDIDDSLTHAYQIPQRSNVGSESLLSFDSRPLSTIRSRSAKSNRDKPVTCPFYVMYFTNLAIQERSSSIDRVASAVSTTTAGRSSRRTRAHSPISHSTNDNATFHSTSYYNNKRFADKMNEFETENSFLLKDVLRTTSWNHLQV